MTSSNGPSAAAPVPSSGIPSASAALPGGSPPVVNREDLPDRVWTWPNALSALRLLGVPLFLYLLLGPEADGWAVAILIIAGFTDWLDGKLARWLNQSSRLGALLDPAADRLYIVSTLVVLRRYGYPPLQVHYLGKAATFLLLYAFPGLLLADGDGWLADLLEPFAWALTIWGTVLYVLAGFLYLVQVAGIVRAERAARTAP